MPSASREQQIGVALGPWWAQKVATKRRLRGHRPSADWQRLFLSEGDSWLRQHRLPEPAFHHERIAAHGQAMVTQTERLLAELEVALPGCTPTAADVPSLPCTGQVVAETQRLFPPAPAPGREAVAVFELGGYQMTRGTDPFTSQRLIQPDPRYFPDPELLTEIAPEHPPRRIIWLHK